MANEAREAAFSCEYSEQNPVYCQQCGGHEHLCRKRLNTEGLTAYFEQMATDGRVETTVQWLVEVSLLIQSDVEKRLKHIHAERTGAIIKDVTVVTILTGSRSASVKGSVLATADAKTRPGMRDARNKR